MLSRIEFEQLKAAFLTGASVNLAGHGHMIAVDSAIGLLLTYIEGGATVAVENGRVNITANLPKPSDPSEGGGCSKK